MYTVGHSRLISTGAYVPEPRITTREIMHQIDAENRFGVPTNWLERVSGIKEKRVTPDGVLPSDMAMHAAKEALDRAGVLPKEIDAIIYVGVVRDFLEPATAHVVQAKLVANNATVFDLANACHGFMNGIHLMDALIGTGQARRGLVVTGEQGKLFTQQAIASLKGSTDKQLLIKLAAGLTLGDAGAAMLMGPKLGPDTGYMGFMLQSYGEYFDLCVAGELLQEKAVVTDMQTIVSEGMNLLAQMYHEFMQKHLKWKTEDIHIYVLHQVGRSIFKHHSQKMGVPTHVMPNSITRMGNLITATIPINLHNVAADKKVEWGQKIYLSGAGSGLSLSQAGIIWDAA